MYINYFIIIIIIIIINTTLTTIGQLKEIQKVIGKVMVCVTKIQAKKGITNYYKVQHFEYETINN